MYSYNNENRMSLIGSTVFARLTGVPNRETNTLITRRAICVCAMHMDFAAATAGELTQIP